MSRHPSLSLRESQTLALARLHFVTYDLRQCAVFDRTPHLLYPPPNEQEQTRRRNGDLLFALAPSGVQT